MRHLHNIPIVWKIFIDNINFPYTKNKEKTQFPVVNIMTYTKNKLMWEIFQVEFDLRNNINKKKYALL